MEQRELKEPRHVVDEVVDAHVESEVAYLEVCPTQVHGLVWCHRVRGWMVMCQWVGVRKVTGQCVCTHNVVWKVTGQCACIHNVVWKVTGQCAWIRNVVWKVTGQCVRVLNVVWTVTRQCVGVRTVVWMVRGKCERATK